MVEELGLLFEWGKLGSFLNKDAPIMNTLSHFLFSVMTLFPFIVSIFSMLLVHFQFICPPILPFCFPLDSFPLCLPLSCSLILVISSFSLLFSSLLFLPSLCIVNMYTFVCTFSGFSFFLVAIHELGHSQGLLHFKSLNSIMYPRYVNWDPTTFHLDGDDIKIIQQPYGLSLLEERISGQEIPLGVYCFLLSL